MNIKKLLIILLTLTVFLSCKNEVKPETTTIDTDGVDRIQVTEGLTTLTGEFSYYKDAAVLQVGNSSIYGVVLNEKMHELYKMGEEFRTEPTDGVQVQIRGEIVPKAENEEGWAYNIDIKEIINIKEPTTKNEVIKIGK